MKWSSRDENESATTCTAVLASHPHMMYQFTLSYTIKVHESVLWNSFLDESDHVYDTINVRLPITKESREEEIAIGSLVADIMIHFLSWY